ncbi:MAG: hypothetical protein HFE63_10585 [Clostridiales bacterium]|nr:hypothetical protein [Clostridiales bacterium]
MNQLYQLCAFLAKAMFKKDSPIIPDNAFPPNSEPGIVLTRIRQLVEEKNINTAENLLFDAFNIQKPYFVAIGLEFYARISEFSDEELEAADFSREEINEGIGDMLKFHNVKIAIKKAPTPSAPNSPAPNVMADPPKEK